MAAAFPQSEAEASDHIRQIRREKGLGEGDELHGHNASDLESVLGVLSHDLYETTTHFLLELIQNADDNTYDDGVTPTVSISYTSGRVRIDCNERGFSKKNVEAICRICKSTKSGASKSAGFVGEKGIGFKAVFKVASSVWISSGHYSFRFDRDGRLGMIAPILDVFPEKRTSTNGTSIYLKLAADCNQVSIFEELKNYDPKILMFLRRLRKVEISAKRGLFAKGNSFKTVLSREDLPPVDGAYVVKLFKDNVKSLFFVWKHLLKNMPKEERRPGITQSEIVLAFQCAEDTKEPVTAMHDVYAFLPVKSVGLPFLLQGDFLLTANRADFHAESAWNKALVTATASAFVDAVVHMSHLSGRLRYMWPSYIPPFPGIQVPSLWQGVHRDINKRLQSVEILETRDGRRVKPKNAMYISRDFCDRHGQPLIMDGKKSLLSKNYGLDDAGFCMTRLGVSCFSSNTLKDNLKDRLKSESAATKFFKDKDETWHRDFCAALNKLDSGFWWLTLRDAYIIPLQDGSWGRPLDKSVFMRPDDDTELASLPQGLKISLVHERVMQCPIRKAFCEMAKIRYLTNESIRGIIIDGHKKNTAAYHSMKPHLLSAAALVSHAVFLFKIGWKRDDLHPENGMLLMATENDGNCRSEEVYLRADKPGSASTLGFSTQKQRFKFLHPLYREATFEYSKSSSWLTWLLEHQRVAIFPRLACTKPCPSPAGENAIHEDFMTIMNSLSTVEWLTILRDGWEYYRKILSPDASSRGSFSFYDVTGRSKAIRAKIQSYDFPCSGLVASAPLSETWQPTATLVREYGLLAPLLDIPDIKHPDWRPLLSSLDVPYTETFHFLAKCLRTARDAGNKFPQSAILRLMKKIDEMKATDNPPLSSDPASPPTTTVGKKSRKTLYEIFSDPDDPLICIPSRENNGERQWVSSKNCYWTGESWLTDLHGLSDIYEEFEILFRAHLLVPDINSNHLIAELGQVSKWSTNSNARIERLLLGLSRYVTNTENKLTEAQLNKLRTATCWPITWRTVNEPFKEWASAKYSSTWLIADRMFFRQQFDEVLPMLALSSDMVFRLMPLFAAIGIQDRLLSRVASNSIKAAGDIAKHVGLTEKYRSRTMYLLRLMPDSQHDRDHIRDKFGSIEVYLASSVLQHWTTPCGIGRVDGQVSEGVAFLESDFSGDLRVYMKTGYDAEPFPIELADRLCEFFNIPATQKDLVNVVLTASIERIDKLFDERGIPPLLEDTPCRREIEFEDHTTPSRHEKATLQDVEKNTSNIALGSNQNSRFGRLLGHKRFTSSVSSSRLSLPNGSVSSLPSYGAAMHSQEAQNNALSEGTSRKAMFHSLSDVEKTLKDLNFQQKDGIVKTQLPEPTGIMERIKKYVQRDNDAAELIIGDVLCAVLGHRPGALCSPRSSRKRSDPAFVFVDSHGRFGSFVQRLEKAAGRGQGYNRFSYSIYVKAAELSTIEGYWQFTVTQAEVDMFRNYWTAAKKPSPGIMRNSENIPVLAVVFDPRQEPKMLFQADPWDLYNEGGIQLVAVSKGIYKASLRNYLEGNDMNGNAAAEADEGGFDAVQIRPHERPTWIPQPPPMEKVNQSDVNEKQLIP